ncbi:MAG: glycosyltransferase family 4 protein, partial [Bacteroidales bacterium]|nr:glycosyltransferase family 4 protein [Bacteroidales bacterium]
RLLLWNKMSGIGWYTYHTLKHLTHMHPEHKFVFLFDRSFDDQFIFGSNVKPVVAYPPARHPFLYYIWFNFSIVPYIKYNKADVFLSPDGFLSLNLKEIPSIPVIHDINFEHFPKDFPFWSRHYYCHYFRKYAHLASRIITVSEFSRQDIAATYKVSPDKIDVVYNGASDEFKPLSEEIKAEVRKYYTQGKEYFVYVGDLLPRKNITRMIMAYEAFRKSCDTDIKLLIVGKNMLFSTDIMEAYSRSEFRDDIFFAGRLPQHELVKVMGSAKALLYVSLFEGFGLPIVEAMKAHVPVITSNVSSMPEIASDAALLVDPFSVDSIKNAMEQIDKDSALRQTLILRGIERSAQFTWMNTAKGVWASIEKALSMKPKA